MRAVQCQTKLAVVFWKQGKQQHPLITDLPHGIQLSVGSLSSAFNYIGSYLLNYVACVWYHCLSPVKYYGRYWFVAQCGGIWSQLLLVLIIPCPQAFECLTINSLTGYHAYYSFIQWLHVPLSFWNYIFLHHLRSAYFSDLCQKNSVVLNAILLTRTNKCACNENYTSLLEITLTLVNTWVSYLLEHHKFP